MMKMMLRPQPSQNPKRRQVMTASSTFDVRDAKRWGSQFAKVRVIGGAGSAALGAGTTTGGGGGGGGGSVTKMRLNLNLLPNTVDVTVGAAGVLIPVSGGSVPSDGGPGGYSQFGGDADTYRLRASGGSGGENSAGTSGTALKGGSSGIGFTPGSSTVSEVVPALSPTTRGQGGGGTSFSWTDASIPEDDYSVTSGGAGGWGKNGSSFPPFNGGAGGSSPEGAAPACSQGSITGGGGGGASGLWQNGSIKYYGSADSFGYQSDSAPEGAVFIELS